MAQNYDFRRKWEQVHRQSRRDTSLTPRADECMIDSTWSIALADVAASAPVALTAAKDLQDYLFTSMGISVPMRKGVGQPREIRLELAAGTSTDASDAGFSLEVGSEVIRVAAAMGRGVFAGTMHVEDMMNLREAPFLTRGVTAISPLIKTRGVHSGFGLDQFPSHHLNAIAHAGFTEIYLFVRGIGECANSHVDFQDLIDRAESYGLDVMFYSYIPSYKHPDDPDAEEFFENSYGRLFERYPKAKGVMLVGESAEFPSRDPATTGKQWHASLWHGIPDPRPSPGWWPCQDYHLWLRAMSKAIRRHKPDAAIVFSTYNWLWAPAEARRKFLEAMPKDIRLLVPFEMFKTRKLDGGAVRQIMDYTISETDFSDCCREEMEMAHQLGLEIGILSMTCGTPWNFGTAPYVPAPFQWIRKFETLREAKRQHGGDNFYDSHHMGWWPSAVTDLAKAVFRRSETDLPALLRRLAVRDYGAAAADAVIEAWRLWSEAMTYYVPSNENQYGPFRVGPSYPFVLHPNVTRTMTSKEIKFPADKHASNGADILKTFFQPFENTAQSPYPLRRKAELASFAKMLELWRSGVAKLALVEDKVPVEKLDLYLELLRLGKFIECFIVTGINTHRWYHLNLKLLTSEDRRESLVILEEIETLAEAEIVNAQNAIPLVEADSRLGWEPSMEYMTDRWHLEWKIKQLRSTIDGDIAAYREMLRR